MDKTKNKKRLIPALVVTCILVLILVAATDEKTIIVSYYGEEANLRQLESNIKTLSCDDHIGKGILTCYNTFEEMLQANNCKIGSNRGEIFCGLDSLAGKKDTTAEAESSKGINGTLYATLWKDVYYEGSSRSLYQDYNDLNSINFNDETSSVTVSSSTTIFRHINFYQGLPLYSSVDDLRDYNFNDVTSSVARGIYR
jgi:hypothetical protein